ncbi:small multidrug efflux protein [Tomitella fengzijianii]|uniref:Small multidrug efflux protein n=1 Tax=Tomitella fengzijianii TaxID=2597660 RepID=A0A516X107_9ACTN|nr:small multidrug efflux protein [Tomitella fengzijianii]QDQ96765.1 small multidrug efflux protein [Tomitella fengzijianii]
MNPLQNLVSDFQELVTQVPEHIRPFIAMLAGAIPFIEGEVGTTIGVIGGINPFVAGLAAALGNFLSVLVVVAVGSRARTAVVGGRTGPMRAPAPGDAEPGFGDAGRAGESKGRRRFRKWLARFGVPGASLLGPLAIPTQFTSAMLVASGTPPARVLRWQAVAIALWTTGTTILVWAALNAIVPS